MWARADPVHLQLMRDRVVFVPGAALSISREEADALLMGRDLNDVPVKAHNRLWLQFVKQLQIVAVTLFLMLQFIWLIFRGNLGTLRMLAEGANRFSQGD